MSRYKDPPDDMGLMPRYTRKKEHERVTCLEL